MIPKIKQTKGKETERRMIIEMIETSMAVSVLKGNHPLTKGCNCIVCVDQRKRMLKKSKNDWQYNL